MSFWYPPETEPRAVQVSRLLKHLKVPTVLVCAGSDGGSEQDGHSDLGDTESFLQAILRVPFSVASWRKVVGRVAKLVDLPIWARAPDELGPWKRPVLTSVGDFIRESNYQPAALITFAYPLVDHMIGLELKRRYHLPWLAHFSDPWLDNTFRTDDPLTKAINASLERQVIAKADRIVFTSDETADLVMSKYDPSDRSKVRIVPHAYEPELFPPFQAIDGSRLTVRYLGDLYLNRTPGPLLAGLRKLLSSCPQLLNDVCFEIVGSVHDLNLDQMGLSQLPKDLVVFRARVSYLESLSLMTSADGLMVIDAPAVNNAKSVFLPSKLIEYIGAGRPVIGLTPQGAAAALIHRLGGWVADPANSSDISEVIRDFISFLAKHKRGIPETWGRSDVRREYEAPVVAAKFEKVLMELV